MTAPAAGLLTREHFRERDRTDPLASFRDRFQLPEGVIYLDGNSLGTPSVGMRARIESLLADEWAGTWSLPGTVTAGSGCPSGSGRASRRCSASGRTR